MCPSVDAIYSWCRRKEQVDSDTGVHLSAMSNQRTLATKTILIKKCPAIRADKDICQFLAQKRCLKSIFSAKGGYFPPPSPP